MTDYLVNRNDNQRVDLIAEVVTHYLPVIGPQAFAIYSYLLTVPNNNGIFPKQATIAKATGIGVTSVKKYLDYLKGEADTPLAEVGYPPLVSVEERKREDGRRTSNLYILERVPGKSFLEKSIAEMRLRDRGRNPASGEGVPDGPDGGEENGSGFAPNGAGRAVDIHDTSTDLAMQPVDLVTAWCQVAGVDINAIVNKGKQFGAAKKLLNAGVRPHHIPDLYRFALGHFRGRHGVDMGVMMGVADEYLAQRNAPTDVFGNPLGKRQQ